MASNIRAVALLSLVVASANVVSGFSGADLSTDLSAVASAKVEAPAKVEWFVAANEAAIAISNDSSAAARVLAVLTRVRAVMQQVTEVVPLPVRVFAVKNESSLRELVPQYWERRGVRPHGASYAGPHAGFIAVRTDISIPQQSSLLTHEYVHLLTAVHVQEAPAWLDEGLSEFWSTLVVNGQQAVIGRPPARHLSLLRNRAWLPQHEMLRHQRGKLAADPDHVAMFYAQSWAMVHYLLLGGSSTSPLSFAPSNQQWTPQLEGALRAYLTEGRFRAVVIPIAPADSTSHRARPISEARALAERANMLVFGERPEAALPLVRRALSLDPREPLALEVMGMHYFLQNQPEQARAWLTQAFDADPDRYSAALYLALLSSSKSERERYLQSAVRLRPDQTLARQRLWTLYAEDGRVEQAGRWCDRLAPLLRPFLWFDHRIHCDWKERR